MYIEIELIKNIILGFVFLGFAVLFGALLERIRLFNSSPHVFCKECERKHNEETGHNDAQTI